MYQVGSWLYTFHATIGSCLACVYRDMDARENLESTREAKELLEA